MQLGAFGHIQKRKYSCGTDGVFCYFGTSGQRRCFRNEYLEGVYFLYLDALGKP
jgi:hypothetical protein